MPLNQENFDSRKLIDLVRELTGDGALAGIIKEDGEKPRGLAFILRNFSEQEIDQIQNNIDLILPLSKNAMAALERLKDIIRENRELKELSITDNLTGLYNSRHFRERLDVELNRVRRTERPCSLIMMDLDHFKPVNDQYGHQAGDELLRVIAEILKNTIRAVDVPVRYGGDELALILPDTGTSDAYKMAERIRSQIEDDPRTARYGVTASFGLATNRYGDMEEASGLVERADQALYQSKREGGNRIRFSETDKVKEQPTEVTVDERASLFAALSGE